MAAVVVYTLLPQVSGATFSEGQVLVASGRHLSGVGQVANSSTLKMEMNQRGDLLVSGHLQTGVNGVAADSDAFLALRSAGGSVSLVAREGSDAPGAGGADFADDFFYLGLSGQGHVAFASQLQVEAGGATVGNRYGVWGPAVGGGTRLVFRQGGAAPGTSTLFGSYEHGIGYIDMADDGSMAFLVRLGSPSAWTDIAMYGSTPSGSLTLHARLNQPAGGANGAKFSILDGPVVSSNGRIVFQGRLDPATVTDGLGNTGVWTGSVTSTATVFRRDKMAADGLASEQYEIVRLPRISDSGHVAFSGHIAGPIEDDDRDQAIWRGTLTGPVSVIAREGDAAPGTNARLGDLLRFNLIDDGSVSFSHRLMIEPGGATTADDATAWIFTDAGGLRLIAREGDPAPLISGAKIGDTILSPYGHGGDFFLQMMLQQGAGGVTSANDDGLWLYSARFDKWHLIAREGDMVTLAPGDERTISNIFTRTLIDGTQVMFHVGFTDKSQAVLMTTIPEPASLALLAVGGLLLTRRR